MKVRLDELNVYFDHRGFVFEPLEAEIIFSQRNVHVVMTTPGEVRGNHAHPKGTETIAVIGPAHVRFRENNELRDIEIPDKRVYRFVFPPGTPHAIKNVGNKPNFLIAFNNHTHNPMKSDVVDQVVLPVPSKRKGRE